MNDEDEPPPTPRQLVEGLVPGLVRPLVLVVALGAAALAIAMALFAITRLGGRDQVAMIVGSLLVWGHGAVWLTTGELQRADDGLSDLSGATWGVFLALWWLPVAVAWGLAGALLK